MLTNTNCVKINEKISRIFSIYLTEEFEPVIIQIPTIAKDDEKCPSGIYRKVDDNTYKFVGPRPVPSLINDAECLFKVTFLNDKYTLDILQSMSKTVNASKLTKIFAKIYGATEDMKPIIKKFSPRTLHLEIWNDTLPSEVIVNSDKIKQLLETNTNEARIKSELVNTLKNLSMKATLDFMSQSQFVKV